MSSPPIIGVFALQGDVREHLRMLQEAGAEARPVRRPSELAAVDALVLPGGESTTMVKLAQTFDLFGPLQQRVAAGMPTLGTCAGMILLADSIEGGIEGQQTLGGLDVVVRRNAFGRQVDSFEADVSFAGFDQPLHAVFIRAPEVEKVGDEVEVLATVRRGDAVGSLSRTDGAEDSTDPPEPQEPSAGLAGPPAGRIVAVRQGAVMATSFHPEITSDDRVHRYFVELVRSS
jgi:5'-phosphate synthase pdxT subunit